jgi:hypothetical protein
MRYLSPLYSVRITIVTVIEKTDLEREAPYLARQLLGFCYRR